MPGYDAARSFNTEVYSRMRPTPFERDMGMAVRPNWSFNRTRYRSAAWPPSAQVHHAPVGQATLPPHAG